MPNLVNKMIVRELTDSMSDAEGLVIVSMAGLSVVESENLRNTLAEKGCSLHMVRSRLARIVLGEKGFDLPKDMLMGNIAMVWGGPEDAINAAKVFDKSDVKKAGKVAFRGGVLEGNLLGADEASQLAKLPGRDELRAQMVGVIAAPLQQLVGLLAAPQGALARVIQAHVDAGDSAGTEEG